jgi:hypothetical protein
MWSTDMNVIVVYSGRFEPPHQGHLSSYNELEKKFPDAKILIVSSGITAPITHPFKFEDKVELFVKLGVPAGNIIQSKSPYQIPELRADLSEDEQADTILIFAVSKKDQQNIPEKKIKPRFSFGIKKNGDKSYMQPYPGNVKQCLPMTKHAYVYETTTKTFKVLGKDVEGATAIRDAYTNGNENEREHIIHDLYGKDDQAIKDLFDQRLGVARKLKDIVIQEPDIDGDVIEQPMPVVRTESKVKLAKLLESTLLAERAAKQSYISIKENLNANYIDEKTGKKLY